MNSEDEKMRLNPDIQASKDMSDGEKGFTSSGDQFQDQQEKKSKTLKWVLIVIGIAVVLALAIVLPIVLTKSGGDEPSPPKPEPPLGNDTIYNPYNTTTLINRQTTVEGYLYAKEPYEPLKHSMALHHLTSSLQGSGIAPPHNLTTYPRQFPVGINNQFMKNLSYQFYMSDYHVAELLITDPSNKRYSIPEEVAVKKNVDYTMKLEMLGLKVFHEPFAFQFADVRDPSNVYVHTNKSTLVFLDKFIQMDFQLPSQKMYGFGERTREFTLGEGTWTMWAHGKKNVYDDGLGGKNSYSVHPFIMVQSKKKGEYFGMYFRNSNAQSPIIRFNKTTGESTLSYITIGGQLEVYFFLHGTAKQIIQQYLKVVGTPNLPPIWSMGWNQASYKYKNQTDIENMIKSYDDNSLPLDGVFLDISYMKNYEDFTVDKEAYPDLQGLASKLHENYRKIIPIIDGYISAEDKFSKYYQLATTEDATIKTTINQGNGYSDNLVSEAWPKKVVFMDWFSKNAQSVWATGMGDLYSQVPYDGVWLDLNEASTFINGEWAKENATKVNEPLNEEQSPEFHRFLREMQGDSGNGTDPDERSAWYKTFPNQTKNSTYFLPFIPGFYYNGNLDNMSLSLNATHPSNGLSEYDLHNLYGHAMGEQTYTYMTHNPDAGTFGYRPFILSRSTFAGSGRWVSHWTGDNYREWAYMNYSIAAIMNFNMFGIPHTGSDICGFYGNTLDQELCARWTQLGTFYPFARNHYDKDSTPSEPYRLTDNWLSTARTAMHDRYQYVRMMYTCLYEASQWGSTCFDPLFYHYADDDKAYEQVEHTFIVGNAIKVSPILSKGVQENNEYLSYFPNGAWSSLIEPGVTVSSSGEYKKLKAKKSVQAHLMPGRIIPFQDNTDQTIKKIHDLRERPISLIINRNGDKIASGSVLLDSGISYIETELDHYEYYTLSYQQKTIQKRLSAGTHGTNKATIDKVVITNAEDLSDTSFACYYTPTLDIRNITPKYDSTLKSLTLIFTDPIPYNQFRQINFGSVTQRDLNLCSPKTYQYQTKEGKIPDLSGPSTTFEAVNLGGVASDLVFKLQVINSNTVNVKWNLKKSSYTPYEVPQDLINITASDTEQPLSNFVKILDQPLRIQIRSKDRKVVATLSEFLLDDYLNYYSQEVNTQGGDNFRGVMGLGERVQDQLFYEDGVYSMWNRDATTPKETGKPPGNNIYGTHPFFMYKNSDTQWVGVFTKLAAAQDWYIKNDKPTGNVGVTLFAAGGLGDVFYMVDSTPNGIAGAYLELVGRPVLTPQWALGWHQCRWGYNTTDALKYVQGNYSKYDLPLDVQWSDIDYMYTYRDFTFDHVNFNGLGDFIDDLHAANKHYVPILDGGIAMRQKGDYPAYDLGREKDIFIKINGETLVGQVWPNDAAYPDWFNEKTVDWYNQELSYLWGTIPYDGLWLDMNEASDFCSGYCYSQKGASDPIKHTMRYTPTGRDLEVQSIPIDGVHSDGSLEVDVHNLFGIKNVQTANKWFTDHKRRPFIITRSSFAGIGKFGSKWGGDNFSQVYYMSQSVISSFTMGVLGVPLYGTDICGFLDDTNAELCARWYVVGAFQTFSRNHNDFHSIPQEPYVFANEEYEKGITYTDIMRIAMRSKYCLLRYYYTHLFMLHKQGGGPFYKPVFFEFPNDNKTYDDQTNNIMLGPSLKLSVLSNSLGVNSTQFYFPKGTWCNIFNPNEKCFSSDGQSLNKRTKAYDYYVHLREGHIIPVQDAFQVHANTTYDLAQIPVDLHINPLATPWAPTYWSASGSYINDDGDQFNITGNHNEYNFVISQGQDPNTGGLVINLQVQSVVATNYPPETGSLCYGINKADYLGQVIIYNAKASGSNSKFAVLVYFRDGSEWSKILESKYNDSIDELKVNFNGEVCLSAISYIHFVKL